MFQATKHPVLLIPTAAQAAAMGEAKWVEFLKRREELIRQENHDPLSHGYEPPIWRICDALQGRRTVPEDWAERVRNALGFKRPVRVLLVLGGNRSGKSEYAGKRVTMLVNSIDSAIAWIFHSTSQMSIETHHKLLWKYMPPAFRHNIRGAVQYISYKQKTGFSDSKYVLPNHSETRFLNYAMEKDDALQGGEIDVAWPDELVPPDWLDDLELRTATRQGTIIVTFTPVAGYTATVRMFQEGAVPVLESVAFMCPRDGQDPAVAQALGFGSQAEMERAHQDERWSLPSKFEFDGERLVERQPEIPVGRKFDRVPRIMRCVDPGKAIVFFHTSDNPFGNPASVIETIRAKSVAFIKERYYGIANKTVSARFPKFNRKVHVVPSAAIPAEGTDYHFVDPASGRNFFMLWFRVLPEAVYVMREWPGNYDIPEVGVPGPWALPDGKKLDGRPGPGQTPFGFGLKRMLREIARLEGWKAESGKREEAGAKKKKTEREWGTQETGQGGVFERYMDSRAASSPRVEHDRPRTLLTDFDELGLTFKLTPGDEIEEGVTLINDALDYDTEKPVDFFNKPRLFVSEECLNTIFSLETWTGQDGNKGACKDPVDLLRYFFLAECEYVSADHWQTTGGGSY